MSRARNTPVPSSVADKRECWDCSLWYSSVTVPIRDHMRMYGGNGFEDPLLSSGLATCEWLASCLSRVNREDRDLALGSLLT